MAREEYEVDAKLELDSTIILRSLNQIAGQLQLLDFRLQKTNTIFGSMVTKAIAFGSAYVGIRAAGRAMQNLAISSFGVAAETQAIESTLAAILSQVHDLDLTEATAQARQYRMELDKLAIKSPATGLELGQIAARVTGPLARAGISDRAIQELSQQASIIGKLHDIDMEQMARDIGMMTRGAAGVDVKTFSVLRSVGAIEMATEEFNQLSQRKRAQVIVDVFDEAGKEAEKLFLGSWEGVSSTFLGFIQQFKRALAQPMFERLTKTLREINNTLEENAEIITAVFGAIGERIGEAYDEVVARTKAFFRDQLQDWDRTLRRLDAIAARLMEMKTLVVGMLKAFVAFQVVGFAFNLLVPVINLVIGAFARLSVLVTAISTGALATAIGGMLATIAGWLVPLLIVIPIVAALVAGFVYFRDTFIPLTETFVAIFGGILGSIARIFLDLFDILYPIFAVLGAPVVGVILIGLIGLAVALNLILTVLQGVTGALRAWVLSIFDDISQSSSLFILVTEFIRSYFKNFAEDLQFVRNEIRSWFGLDRVAPLEFDAEEGLATQAWRKFTSLLDRAAEGVAKALGPGPEEVAKYVNDFRGSTINVRQDFREANPNRVWIQMRDALEREAVSRTQSGLAGAFSR